MPPARSLVLASLLLAAPAGAAGPAAAQGGATPGATGDTWAPAMPLASAEEGKRLFVGKGCVVCHAVNGVGDWMVDEVYRERDPDTMAQ